MVFLFPFNYFDVKRVKYVCKRCNLSFSFFFFFFNKLFTEIYLTVECILRKERVPKLNVSQTLAMIILYVCNM